MAVDKVVYDRERKGNSRSRLNLVLIKRFVQELETGLFFETVCDLVGVPRGTAIGWRERGERLLKANDGTIRRHWKQFDRHLALFAQECRKAEAVVEQRMLRILMEHSDRVKSGDWRAAKEYLGKRFRSRWGDKQVIEADVLSRTFKILDLGPDDKGLPRVEDLEALDGDS